MTDFVQNTGTKIVLRDGVTLASINSARDLVLKNQKEINKRIDEISVAYAAHLISQEQFETMGNKGDITQVKRWIEDLFVCAPAQANAIVRWYKDLFGFDMTVVHKDDDNPERGYECRMTMVKDRDFAKVRAGLFEKMRRAMDVGICQDTEKYFKPRPKRRVPKASGNNGEIVEVNPVIYALEKSGVVAAVEAAESDADMLAYFAQIATVWSEHPNRKSLTDLLDSTVKKMRNGLNLKVAVNS